MSHSVTLQTISSTHCLCSSHPSSNMVSQQEDSSANLRRLLASTKLQALRPKPQEPVVLRYEHTVEHVLEVLAAKKILSAPVVACSEGDAPDDCTDVIGFVDIRDILVSFLSGGDGTFMLDSGLSKVSVMELVHNGFLYPRETKAVHAGDTSRTVVHRVGLFNRGGHITNIISQSDVVRWLGQQLSGLGALQHKTMQELGWASKNIKSLPAGTPAIQCLELMQQSGLSAIAITDSSEANQLIGNFSVSDLRTMVSEHFGSLALPVGEFLALEHGLEYWGVQDHEAVKATAAADFIQQRKQRDVAGPGDQLGQSLVTCSPQDTFPTIIERIVEHHLHRIYVVDTQGQAVGVATLTDILRQVTEEARTA